MHSESFRDYYIEYAPTEYHSLSLRKSPTLTILISDAEFMIRSDC